MAVTVTKQFTLKEALNEANPNRIADALRKVELGDILTPISTTITQAAAGAVGLDPPALLVQSVRVIAGVAAAGVRAVGDAGATASVTVAVLAANGTGLAFEADVTQVAVVYIPRPSTSLTADFAPV